MTYDNTNPEERKDHENTISTHYGHNGEQGLVLHQGSRLGPYNLAQYHIGDGESETISATNWTTLKSGWVPPLHFPPGARPIVVLTGRGNHGAADAEGLHVRARFDIGSGDSDLNLHCQVTQTDPMSFYKEDSLAGPFEWLSTGDDNGMITYLLEARVDSTDSVGTLNHDITMSLYHEVV